MSTWKIIDWKTFFCFIVNKIWRFSEDFCVFVLQSGFLAVSITTVMKITSSSERWRLQASDQICVQLFGPAVFNTSTTSSRAGAGSSFTPHYSSHWIFSCTADFDVVFQALWGRSDSSSVHLTVLSFHGEKLSDVHRWDTDSLTATSCQLPEWLMKLSWKLQVWAPGPRCEEAYLRLIAAGFCVSEQLAEPQTAGVCAGTPPLSPHWPVSHYHRFFRSFLFQKLLWFNKNRVLA